MMGNKGREPTTRPLPVHTNMVEPLPSRYRMFVRFRALVSSNYPRSAIAGIIIAIR